MKTLVLLILSSSVIFASPVRSLLLRADATLERQEQELTAVRQERTALKEESSIAITHLSDILSDNNQLASDINAYKSWAEAAHHTANENAIGWQKSVDREKEAIARADKIQAEKRTLKNRIDGMFGIGAIFYGIQRLLTFSFWGILILGLSALALAIFCPLALHIIKYVIGSFVELFKRKPKP
jgi:hypothetical protein